MLSMALVFPKEAPFRKVAHLRYSSTTVLVLSQLQFLPRGDHLSHQSFFVCPSLRNSDCLALHPVGLRQNVFEHFCLRSFLFLFCFLSLSLIWLFEYDRRRTTTPTSTPPRRLEVSSPLHNTPFLAVGTAVHCARSHEPSNGPTQCSTDQTCGNGHTPHPQSTCAPSKAGMFPTNGVAGQ